MFRLIQFFYNSAAQRTPISNIWMQRHDQLIILSTFLQRVFVEYYNMLDNIFDKNRSGGILEIHFKKQRDHFIITKNRKTKLNFR